MHETVDAFDEEAFDEFPVKVMTSSSLSYFLSAGTHICGKKSGKTIAQCCARFVILSDHPKKSKKIYQIEEIIIVTR